MLPPEAPPPPLTKFSAGETSRTEPPSTSVLPIEFCVSQQLPLPSPPFLGSNALPSYGIILVAVSMMEEDGVMIWFGYLASLVATAYFVIMGGLIATHLAKWFQALLRLMETTQ